MAEIHMELNKKAEKSITEYLAGFDEIKSIFFLTGRLNCRALAAFKSNDEFQKFMRTVIANIEGLNSVETHIYLEIMKGQFWFWCQLD
jgi:DNA-binding Lrp family transcriptional regulator